MTTHAEVAKSRQAVQAPWKTKLPLAVLGVAVLIIFSFVSASMVALQPMEKDTSSTARALEVISNRYQGMADSYVGGIEVKSQQALAILSNRYQGLANQNNAVRKVDTHSALEILSARYQGVADLHTTGEKAVRRALGIISSRYQGLVDQRIAVNEVNALHTLEILSTRYQGMADLYIGGNQK